MQGSVCLNRYPSLPPWPMWTRVSPHPSVGLQWTQSQRSALSPAPCRDCLSTHHSSGIVSAGWGHCRLCALASPPHSPGRSAGHTEGCPSSWLPQGCELTGLQFHFSSPRGWPRSADAAPGDLKASQPFLCILSSPLKWGNWSLSPQNYPSRWGWWPWEDHSVGIRERPTEWGGHRRTRIRTCGHALLPGLISAFSLRGSQGLAPSSLAISQAPSLA